MPGFSDSRRRRRRAWLGATSLAVMRLCIPLVSAAGVTFRAQSIAASGTASGATAGRLQGTWLVLIILGAVALVCAVAAMTYLHVGAHHAGVGRGYPRRGTRGRDGVTHSFCTSCGVRLDADATLCRNCGRRV